MIIKEFKDKYREVAAQKRAELEKSARGGLLADPISAVLIPALIGAAVSTAAGPLTRRAQRNN